MKAFDFNGQITSIRSRQDHSLGLSVSTPEVTKDEAAGMLELQGLNLRIVITPSEFADTEVLKIDRGAGSKSPSERLRGVIYRVWEGKKGKWPDSEMFYRHTMERIIEQLKDQI